MKWCRSNGRVLTLMLALAFFNFIFLVIEYQFDNMMALVTGFLYKRKIWADCCVCRSTGRGDLYFCNLAA